MTEDDSKKEELNEPELVVLDSKDSLRAFERLDAKKRRGYPRF